ncbi:MAG: ABC transporter permease subunit [Anaerolineales bacterium]|nr:ABC transporter permease subunit [Anaerolineales bacterium]
MNFLAALRKEWLEQWRTHRLLTVGVVLAVFGLLSPLIAKYTPEIIKLIPNGEAIAQLIPTPTAMDAVTQYIKNIGQFGVILALLLTMGAVAQEKDKGTAAMMLVKPLPRATFLVAKFTALALMFTVAIALAGAACYYYTWLLFGALNAPRWLALNGLMLLLVLVHVALTLFCSVAAKSQAAAGGLALCLLFILWLIGSIPGLGEYLPGQLIAWGGGLMAGQVEAFWPALWVSMGIIVVALMGAMFIFERQEL